MANLYLSVKGQTLTVKSDIDRIVENSINYLKINIDTSQDPEWKDLNVKCILSNKEKSSAFYENNYITEDFLKAPGFVVHLIGFSLEGESYNKIIPTNPIIVNVYPTGVLNAEDEPGEEVEVGWADRVIQSFNDSIEEIISEKIGDTESINNKIEVINGSSTHDQYPTAKAVYQFVNNSMLNRLTNALKTYFTDIQVLLPQLAFVTEDNIGNVIIQNAQNIVNILEDNVEDPELPLDKTLVSISATYTGGNVNVGKDVTSLTGITVTATYSDGSTSEVTGYTLSGEIAEGENTITVTYNGLTTTFTVVGEEVVIDENAVNIYKGFLSMDSTATSEPTTDSRYPNAVCSDLIPVNYEGGGSWTYDVKLNSNISDTSKINWKSYDETGARKGSTNGDTVPNIMFKYGVRLNILDQTATADGSNAVITGFTVTVKIGPNVKAVYEIGVNDLRG